MSEQMESRLAAANALREKEFYGDSIKVYTECLVDLIDTNDYVGLVHCLCGQSLVYKNLTTKNNSPLYHSLQMSFSKEGCDVAEQNSDKIDARTLSIGYSTYGDALLANGEYQTALSYFEKSLAVSTASIPEKGRLKGHIGGINVYLGEKEKGLALMLESLSDIRSGNMEDSTIRTWETGTLNGLAVYYAHEGDTSKALGYAGESKQIAEKYNLPIRLRQIQHIIEQISSGATNISI